MFIALRDGEVLEAAAQPRGARRVLAAPDDLFLVALRARCRTPGTSVGITHGFESAGRRLSTGATTFGMTSPPFSMMHRVAFAQVLARRCPRALCSVAIDIVDPARKTGSSTA